MIDLSEIRADRTRYDAGRKRSGKSVSSGRSKNNMLRPILAIDGEGVTDRRKRHHYILLAASDGSYVNGDSLSTVECFSYLLSLPRNHLIVGFSLNYDICKWFRDIPREALSVLWETGGVTWDGYRIGWRPSKSFDLSYDGKSVRIYDVFGFYQESFVKALQTWDVATPDQLERIAGMKASRSVFSREGFSEILAYCQEECQLLVQMVDKLRRALMDIDLTLNQWHGAGAIATAIFQKEGVKAYIGRPDENGKPQGAPKQYSHPIMSAYYGGRFELHRSGQHDRVYTYDIRSAYPHIATSLPCLTHVTYNIHEGYYPSEWGMCYVNWEIEDMSPWPPFPFRVERTRQILHPRSGSGWYHQSEVRAALRFFGDGRIRVARTLALTRHCDHRPFYFVPDYYRYRNELKRQGHQGQLTIKLGLNSLYGKTAQGIGWGDEKPPYQSYLWAGMITAGTRAMLMGAIAQNPDAIVATATDGIISLAPLSLDIGSNLGQWEAGEYQSFFSVQSGVYETWEGVPYAKQIKSRGFGKSETSFDDIRASWQADKINGTFGYRTTRFIGLGAANKRAEFWRYFGQWVEMDRVVNFGQEKRWTDGVEPDGSVLWWPKDRPEGQEESAPFLPRSSWADLWGRDDDAESFAALIDADQP